jgi:hypothetical protein
MKELFYVERELIEMSKIKEDGNCILLKKPVPVIVIKWNTTSAIIRLEGGKIKAVDIDELWDCKSSDEALAQATKENQE